MMLVELCEISLVVFQRQDAGKAVWDLGQKGC